MKLLIFCFAGLLVISPFCVRDRSPQERVESLIRSYLSLYGTYMAIYFSDMDTAFTRLGDEPFMQALDKKMIAYQDSAVMFSRSDSNRSNAFYSKYKLLSLQKDSIRSHYTPRPMGYLIIHHFQLSGKPWTDSFMVDYRAQHILKIKETIE